MSVPFLQFTADSAQIPNLGGGSWLAKINCENIIKKWPQPADIVNGVIQTLPILRADAGINIITPVPGTLQYKYPTQGRHGHQHLRHEITYEVANESVSISVEMEKDLNDKSVFIVMKPDGRMLVLGSSTNGLQVRNDGDSGLEGGENKTIVTAFSECQTGRPRFLLDELEKDIRAGHDGYSRAISTFLVGIFIATGNVATRTLFEFNELGVAVSIPISNFRKFKPGDNIKINSLDVPAFNAGRIVILPDSAGYATSTLTAVTKTTTQTITLGSTVAFNMPSGGLKPPYIFQKL
jgi:hypothetical protein